MAQAAALATMNEPQKPSPLDEIVHKAGKSLQDLRMTKLYAAYTPDREDAKALVDDLLAIARIIDPVILAIGDYAAEHYRGIDLVLFEDQLLNALSGNATFEIESAVERAADEVAEYGRA